MSINWNEVQQVLYPIKDCGDLCRRFQTSFAFPFVRQKFDFSMPDLISYTQRLLGGDGRGRYAEYSTRLVDILTELRQADVTSVLELVSRTASQAQLQAFSEQSGIPAPDIVALLKYLIYWFIPGEKYLSGLIQPGSTLRAVIQVLGELGIRTDLDLRGPVESPEPVLPEDTVRWLNLPLLEKCPHQGRVRSPSVEPIRPALSLRLQL